MKKEELLRKSLLLGVGVASFAQDKVGKTVQELLKKGHISRAEGQKLVRKVVAEAQTSGKRIAGVMQSELNRVLKIGGASSHSAKKANKKKK
ncbi:hypothetical protein HYU21_02120 [Candidatus Woesearchaeota archaeon]|nr:hypothetical protein [Candidatus Woesearchaeota archaeon]